MQTRERKKKRK